MPSQIFIACRNTEGKEHDTEYRLPSPSLSCYLRSVKESLQHFIWTTCKCCLTMLYNTRRKLLWHYYNRVIYEQVVSTSSDTNLTTNFTDEFLKDLLTKHRSHNAYMSASCNLTSTSPLRCGSTSSRRRTTSAGPRASGGPRPTPWSGSSSSQPFRWCADVLSRAAKSCKWSISFHHHGEGP